MIVTLDNTSLFQDGGDFQIGRAGRALVGTIERIDAGSITVNTKLGPLTATIVAGETAFKTPSTVAAAQLAEGQLVTVTGSESPSGRVAARSVLITPELGELMSAGRQGGREGRGGGGGGGRDQGSTPSSQTPEASPIFDTERKAGIYDGITFVVTERSRATFRVREQLALIPLPHQADMRTTALSGEIHFDGRPSVIEIDLHQLSSGQNLRDGYVRRAMFPDHPKATFTLENVASLPPGFAEGEASKSRIDGVLNISGEDFPLRFNITAQDKGDAVTIVGRTRFTWEELGIKPPTAGVVLTLDDEVEVRIRLTVKPIR
ncbi:MAG: hypothetical protein CMJ45_11505 [Planctomyces sp.]|nr:hypothetical protein [Planctomyces sp.]